MLKIIHPVAGALALLTIGTFWLSTALSELFASQATVSAVKTTIPWGFLLLIPALAVAGGSGFALAKGRRVGLIGTKLKRMPWIAANGLLVLIPSALFLASMSLAMVRKEIVAPWLGWVGMVSAAANLIAGISVFYLNTYSAFWTVVGFGSFSSGKRAARTGRNPRTGETIKIPAAKTVKFSAGQGFKDAVNKKK